MKRLAILATLTLTLATTLNAATHVVIGTRNLAHAVTRELIARKQAVTVIAFNKEKTEKQYADAGTLVTVVQAAVEKDSDTLKKVAADAQYIFFAPHYPYNIWHENMFKAVKNVIYAAEKQKATIIFPSKVYSLGRGVNMPELHDGKPCSEQGTTFAAIERELIIAAQAGLCKSIIVRHAHAFGPYIVDGLMDRAFKNALNKQAMQWVYRTDVDYQVALSTDIARCLVELTSAQLKGPLGLFHFAGTVVNVEQWLAQINAAAKNTTFATNLDGWFKVKMLSALQSDARACKDIFYMFEDLVSLGSTQLEKTIKVQKTDMVTAIKNTLDYHRG